MIPVSSRIENVMFDDAAVWVGRFMLAFHVRAYTCDDSGGFGIRAWGRYGDFLEGLVDCKSVSSKQEECQIHTSASSESISASLIRSSRVKAMLKVMRLSIDLERG